MAEVTYDGLLVVFSIIVAVLAAFVALDMASRIVASRGRSASAWLLLGGAAAMGGGIWAMHFIGMLACHLPMQITYDVPVTLLSLLLADLASGLALYTAARGTLSKTRLLGAGAVMGAGIVSMHYVGMAAMQVAPPPHYDPAMVVLSGVVALAASLVSIRSAFQLRLEGMLSAFWRKTGSALVMGAGIAGMHYTAMAATRLDPHMVSTVSPWQIDNGWLAVIVGTLSIGFMAGTLLVAAFDAYVATQATDHAQQQRQLNDQLQRLVADLVEARAGLEARVAERTREIQMLSRHLVETVETERRQLARELHDRVGQNLTALGINLEIIRANANAEGQQDLRSRLDDSIALVQATADAIENVMAELRPPMLDEHGLRVALQWYGRKFSQRTGIDVQVWGDDRGERPSREIEIALFRIAQEALNNVARHARGTRVDVAFEQQDREFVLSVWDDGIGFDQAQSLTPPARPHWGLGTMRERAEAVAGRFEVISTVGGGTRVVVRIPNQK